jgi:hypothetical protein
MADANSVLSIVDLKPPRKPRKTARPRSSGRKKPAAASAAATSASSRQVAEAATAPRSHPGQARDSSPLLGAILLLVAAAVAALGIGINAQTGWRFGTTMMSAATFAGVSVAADVLAVALPTVAVALWLRRRRPLASAAWATWSLSLALAVLASIGFVNRHVGDAAAARAATVSTAAARTAQRDAAITTAQRAAAAAAVAREAECKIRGQRCRALEQEEQARLTEVSAALALPLPAAAALADADPQLAGVLRLANWVGLNVTANDLGNLRLMLMALLPNLAGLILCFGVALRWSALPARA